MEGVIGQAQRDNMLGGKEGESEEEAGSAHTCGHAVSDVQGCCCAEKSLPSHCQGKEKRCREGGAKEKRRGRRENGDARGRVEGGMADGNGE